MSIKPTIKGKEILKIEIGNINLIPKKTIDIDELAKIAELLEYLTERFNFQERKEDEELRDWSTEEIFDFLNDRTDIQRAFSKVVAEAREIYDAELLEKLRVLLNRPKLRLWDVGGALAGMTNRAVNALRKKPLFEIAWKNQVRYYKVNEEYAQILREWAREQSL